MHNFDFTAMERFWEIFQILRADQEPPPELWDKLFATPGYAVLTQSEFSRDYFIRQFSVAFRPGLTKDLEQALAKDHYGILAHYLKVRDNPEKIREQQRLLANSEYHAQVIDKCIEWLPIQEVQEYPSVAFVIFQNDARGYNPVVMDVLATIQLGDFMPLFLAHEFHHWYRNRMLVLDWGKAPSEYSDLIWVLDQVHMEGLADNIDKAPLMAAGHPFVRDFEGKVEKAPEYIRLLDEEISRLAKGEQDPALAGKLLRDKLPQAGHPVGFYMAREILSSLGKQVLVRTASNPLDFFRSYGGFCPVTIGWLEKLESIVEADKI